MYRKFDYFSNIVYSIFQDTLDVLELKPGDTFTPHYDGDNLLFKEPEMRTPLTPTPFIVSETPYVTNLRFVHFILILCFQ